MAYLDAINLLGAHWTSFLMLAAILLGYLQNPLQKRYSPFDFSTLRHHLNSTSHDFSRSMDQSCRTRLKQVEDHENCEFYWDPSSFSGFEFYLMRVFFLWDFFSFPKESFVACALLNNIITATSIVVDFDLKSLLLHFFTLILQ